MRLVVDASVALKWLFRSREDEPDIEPALALLNGVFDDRITLLQPPHFIAEVSAVLARESSAAAELALRDLLDIEMETVDGEPLYQRAVALSVALNHHLFDTLYHAAALEHTGAALITADERYYRKARSKGRIVRLADFGLRS